MSRIWKYTILTIATALMLLFIGMFCVSPRGIVIQPVEDNEYAIDDKDVSLERLASEVTFASHGGRIQGTSDNSHIELLSSKPGETRLRFHLGEVTVGRAEIGGAAYCVVTAPGCAQAGRAGEPELPEFRFDVAAGANVECEIEECAWEDMEAPPPLPSAGAYWRSFGHEGERAEDRGIYGGGDVYPAEVASVWTVYRIRGVSGAEIVLRPVRYDFGRGVLRTAKSMNVIVRDGAGQGGEQSLDANASFANIQCRQFVNASALVTRSVTDANPIGRLLMVLPDEWAWSVQDFVSWKRKVGFDVDVCRYPEETGEGATALAEHIRKAYGESAVTHIILCGDSADVPPAYTSESTQSPGVKEPTSDVRYAFLSGDDCVADAFISRIPAHSGEQLYGVLSKMISYECEPPEDDSWREKPLIMCSSERSSSGLYKNISDYKLLKDMYDGLVNDGVYANDEGRVLCDSTTTSANALSVLNGAGTSLLCYLGHGLYNSWVVSSRKFFKVSDVTGMQNGMLVPFVLSPVCDSGNFANKDGDCMSESFFLNGQFSENGAVAVVGATSQTLWNPPIRSILEFAELLKMAYTDGRALSTGELFQRSILSGMQLAASEHSTHVEFPSDYFACQMHLFGDCTMMPRLRKLRPVSVTTSCDGDSLTVGVKWSDDGQPIKGAYVTVFSGERCIARMVCDESGNAIANVSGIIGEVTVNVNDFSIRPYAANAVIDRRHSPDADGDGFVANEELLAFLAHGETCAVCKNKMEDAIESWKRCGTAPTLHVATVPNVKYFEITDTGINTYGSILAEMDALATQHCDICRVEYIGQSREGREIRGLCISASDEKDVPHLLVVAGCNQDERNSAQIALHFARFLIEDKELASRAAYHVVPLLYPDEWEGAASVEEDTFQERKAFRRWAADCEFASAVVLDSGDATMHCPAGALSEQSINYSEFSALRNAWTENCGLVGNPSDDEKRSPLLDILYKDLGVLPVEANVGENRTLGGKMLQSLCSSCEKAFAAWCKVATTGFSLCLGAGFMDGGIWLPYSLSIDGHERTAWLSGGKRCFWTLSGGAHEMTAISDGVEQQSLRFTVNDSMTPLTLAVHRDVERPVQGVAFSPRRYIPNGDCSMEVEYAALHGGPLIWNVWFPQGCQAFADAAYAFRSEADGGVSFLFINSAASGRLNCRLIPYSDDAEESKVVSTLLWNGISSKLTRRWDSSEKRTVRYSVESGWNILGATIVAPIPSDCRAWKYDNGFLECKSMIPGNALWLYSDKMAIVDITGWYLDGYINKYKAGWNLVSPMRHVRACGKCLEYSRESRCFRRADDVLKPGNAYWVFGE